MGIVCSGNHSRPARGWLSHPPRHRKTGDRSRDESQRHEPCQAGVAVLPVWFGEVGVGAGFRRAREWWALPRAPSSSALASLCKDLWSPLIKELHWHAHCSQIRLLAIHVNSVTGWHQNSYTVGHTAYSIKLDSTLTDLCKPIRAGCVGDLFKHTHRPESIVKGKGF